MSSPRQQQAAISSALVTVVMTTLACGGCGQPRRSESDTDLCLLHDLVAEAPRAAVRDEVLRFDFGTAAARTHMARGWSRDDREADGTPFVWSSGPSSVLEFFLEEARDLTLSFDCFPFAGETGQRLALSVNGQVAGDVLRPVRAFFSLDLDVHRTVAVQDGDWKLIRETGAAAQTQLFDLREDPAESDDLFDTHPIRARYLLSLIEEHERSVGRQLPARTVVADPELREKLGALGYVR